MRRKYGKGAAIEAQIEPEDPPQSTRWHSIIQEVDQTEEEAIDAYGRDRIGPNDFIIFRVIVDPEPR